MMSDKHIHVKGGKIALVINVSKRITKPNLCLEL